MHRANKKDLKCQSCAHIGKINPNGFAGKTKETSQVLRRMSQKAFIEYETGKRKKPKIWAQGLTNETSEKVRMANEKRKKTLKVNKANYLSTGAYSLSACSLFDEINLEMGWNGSHALNGGEFKIKNTRFSVDFYEEKLNIVIEYYEAYHNTDKQKIKDKIRNETIRQRLNCSIYIIKHNEKHLWRQIIKKQF